MPRAVAQTRAWRRREQANADGLIAVGGGAAIGLAKAIALETELPILAVPTTYSGSEASPLFGTTDGERKITGRDRRVVPRTIVYDPDLTRRPARGGQRGERDERDRALRRGAVGRRAHAGDRRLRGRRAAPLRPVSAARRRRRLRPRGARGMPGRGLARRQRAGRRHRAASQARACAGRAGPAACARRMRSSCRMSPASISRRRRRRKAGWSRRSPPTIRRKGLPPCCGSSPFHSGCGEVGFDREKTDFVAGEIAAMSVSVPRKAGVEDVRAVLEAAY